MDKKQAWLQLVQEKSEHYLNLHDGGFDEKMRARLVSCDYENQTVTYAFPTQTWQINEKGGIHGGAIAGMFDTAFGVVANFTAGEYVTLWFRSSAASSFGAPNGAAFNLWAQAIA